MTNTNATNFRQNLFAYLDQAVLYNDVITVSTKSGNAVVLSEEDYAALLETLHLMHSGKTYAEIQAGMREPLSEGEEYRPGDDW